MKIFRVLRKNNGASAVEFAIVLPLFMMLIFGMIEFSLILYAKAVITNASREGARLGISSIYSESLTGDAAGIEAQIVEGIKDRIADDCLYSISESRLINLGGPTLSKTALRDKIFVSPLDADNIRTVTVEFPYDFLLAPSFMPGIPETLTISATTKMRME